MDVKKTLRVMLPLIFFIILSVILFILFTPGEKGDRVIVRLDGVVIGEYPLDENITVSLNGGSNIMVIKNGKACVESADCPDKVCVRQGWVSRMGECITCLPNRLVIEVMKLDDSVDLVV